MCDRFAREYFPYLRASSAGDYETAIRLHIRPALGRQKVCALTYGDIAALHRRISVTATYQANRAVAVLSRMLNLTIKWGWRSDNPARGVQRNQEEKRHRYLTADELGRLTKALVDHPDKQAANIFRLLLLTGARRGEVQAMRWGDLDLTAGVWTKPASLTKQRALHRVPLSAPARQLLAELEAERDGAEFVFGGRFGAHRVELKAAWAALCKSARISNLRIHDLRHSFASQAASMGLSLPTIGALLGHTQPSTTHRYSHLIDDVLRRATESIGAQLSPGRSGFGGPASEEVVR
jgi:integrase